MVKEPAGADLSILGISEQRPSPDRPPAKRKQMLAKHKGCFRIALIFAASGRYGLPFNPYRQNHRPNPGSIKS
jgi:hypothetical protein